MISLKKNTCRVLIVAMMALSFQTARAGMIGTEQAAADGGAATQRSLVMSVLDRAETVAQLQAQGIDPAMARERVASMTAPGSATARRRHADRACRCDELRRMVGGDRHRRADLVLCLPQVS